MSESKSIDFNEFVIPFEANDDYLFGRICTDKYKNIDIISLYPADKEEEIPEFDKKLSRLTIGDIGYAISYTLSNIEE